MVLCRDLVAVLRPLSGEAETCGRPQIVGTASADRSLGYGISARIFYNEKQ
jgi:hypothetical protein